MKTVIKELGFYLVAAFLAVGWGLFMPKYDGPIVYEEPKKAVTMLVMLVLSFALSYAAAYFLQEKDDAIIKDDKPTTLTSRGSYVAWHIGRRRVGPVFAWAGERGTKKERIHGGGKGSKKKKTKVFVESGWHQICVGPCLSLHKIYQNGEIIFEGPINSVSHPSGSLIELGKEGSFYIYWGEADQPVNAFLGNADRVGINSRWPHLCYVVWVAKRLGGSAHWPMIEYVVERHPTNSVLSDSDPWTYPDYTITSTVADVFAGNDGAPGVGYLTFIDDWAHAFPSGCRVDLVGNGHANGTYHVLITEVFQYNIGTPEHHYYETRTRVYFSDVTLTGSDGSGTLTPYATNAETGVNPAHALAEILFASWPYGLALSQSDWNIDSLEELGVLASAQTGGEELWTSWVSLNGDKASQLLAQGMQDLGLLLPFNTTTGVIDFYSVRAYSGTLPSLGQDMLLSPLPTREVVLSELPGDQILFEFPDQAINWRKMTIMVAEDAHSGQMARPKSQKTQITIADHFIIASKIAERRSQETLGGGSVYTVHTCRWARTLLPGQAIEVYGFDEALRVVSVTFQGDTAKVTLQCIPDFYGAAVSDFEPTRGAGIFEVESPEQDQFDVVEVPKAMLGGTTDISFIVPRIRAHEQMNDADIHISADEATFNTLETQTEYHQGGVLLDALASTSLTLIDEGPTFTVFGDDIADALDLSADSVSWRAGRQVAVINGEYFFVKKLTAVSATVYRLDGLIRARYDTRKVDHAVGDNVYIFANDDIGAFTDILCVPAATIYVKSQPTGSGGPVPLGNIPPRQLDLYGKGIVPEPVENVRLSAPYKNVAAYRTGDNMTVTWTFYSDSGGGFRPAGDPQQDPSVDGDFFIEILSSADVLQREILTTDLSYDYSNVNLLADFGSEPASFKIRVSVIKDGWQSSTETTTIEKVS